MSLRDYDLMLARQRGVCAVCGEQPARRLCVDHCHVTGKVRGLLCSPCNLAIGQLKDSPARLRKAAAYVEAALDASLDGEYAYRAPERVAPPRRRWRRAAALRAKLIDPKLFDPLPQAGDQLLAVGEMPLLHIENAREAAFLERQHVDPAGLDPASLDPTTLGSMPAASQTMSISRSRACNRPRR